MRLNRFTSERGDTLIEVIVAFAVFSLLAVGAFIIMNQGIASAQRALEITQVRAQIDGQAATLRYIHQVHLGLLSRGAPTAGDDWSAIAAKAKTAASSFGLTPAGKCPVLGDASQFFVDPDTAKIAPSAPQSFGDVVDDTPPYAQIFDGVAATESKGLWIEAVQTQAATPGNPSYIDFHIRACWDSVGSNVPVTLGTIVRLYEPAS